MSIRSVNAVLKQVTTLQGTEKTPRINSTELTALLNEANKNGLTAGERSLLVDTWSRSDPARRAEPNAINIHPSTRARLAAALGESPTPAPVSGAGLGWEVTEVDLSLSPNRNRAEQALDALNRLVAAANGAITKENVTDLVKAMAIPRGEDAAGHEGVLSPVQALAAAKLLTDLPAQRRDSIRALLSGVGASAPALERVLLLEAMTARQGALMGDDASANAALGELTAFAADIRGSSVEKLIDFSCVVDLDMDAEAEGLMQRYVMSCVPTSFQLIRAEADPIYAWALSKEGVASLSATGRIAEDQQKWLTEGGGVAEPREGGYGGQGMWPETIIDQVLAATTGHKYARHDMSTPELRQAALDQLRPLLESGLDVPIVAGPSTNHCMVFSDVRASEAGGYKFLMQDPWTGQSTWMQEKDIVAGNTTFSTMTWANLWITYDPSPAA